MLVGLISLIKKLANILSSHQNKWILIAKCRNSDDFSRFTQLMQRFLKEKPVVNLQFAFISGI